MDEEKQKRTFLYDIFRNRRFTISSVGLIISLTGFLIVIVTQSNFTGFPKMEVSGIIAAVATIFGLFFLVNTMAKFLEGSRSENIHASTIEQYASATQVWMIKEIKQIKKTLAGFQLEKTSDGLDVDQILKLLDVNFAKSAESAIDKAIAEKLEVNEAERKNYTLLGAQLDALQFGINRQIDRLSRNGTTNLIIGLLASSLSISILGYLALTSRDIPKADFYYVVIPRVSLALFIEIISFFFLNLYKRAMNDIKYFQNERTNIDSKAIALRIAIYQGNEASLGKIITEYSKVERNFMLKKGETTSYLELEKLESKVQEQFLHLLDKFGHKLKSDQKD